mgnify:CR=1 FL=1
MRTDGGLGMTETLIDIRKSDLMMGEVEAWMKRYARLHPLQDVHLDGDRYAIVADWAVIA